MKNKILKKYFFIKKDYATYCGKCGKKQLQDSYNLKKHASECGFPTDVEPRVFEDGNDYAYSFKISDDNNELYFYVFSYNLKLRPGFKDRYCGSEWKTVFKATFRRDSKTVEEKGLYNIDVWMKKMMDEKHIPSLSADNDICLFKNFFTDILSYDCYGSFLDIYRNKGYGNKKLLSNEEAEKLLKYKSENWLTEITASEVKVYGDIIEIGEELLLHIWVTDARKSSSIITEILISDKYTYSNGDCKNVISKLLCPPESLHIVNLIDKEIINRFDEKYPMFMISNYLKCGGSNILMPLFASNFNKCLELLYKAGIPSLAETFYDIKKNNELVMYKNNLKEIFGIPVKTLKKIASTNCATEKNIFIRLKEIYEYDPRYLSLENYGLAVLSLLKYQNITHNKDFSYHRTLSIKSIKSWNDDELFRTLKYLNKMENDLWKSGNEYYDVWDMYKDYLNGCEKLATPEKPYYFGKWPKDLEYAHETIAELIYEKDNEEVTEIFKVTVSDEDYLRLMTNYGEEKEDFENDKYVIYAPKKPYDLYNESAQMNNCVKKYVSDVANGKTRVYFLRDKKCPSKSVCTIEVLPNNDLIQLKAYGNHMASTEIKSFVRKWAKIKGIRFASRDIS